MSHTPYISSSYLHCMLDKREFDRRVSTARDILSKYKYDAIAFRGMSGALLAAPLAHMLDKTMIMVRKPKVDCHTSRAVEGDNAARRYIIVDDVICSGNTLRTIIRAVKRFAPAAECVGYLEWNNLYAMSHELESCERFKPSASERFDEFGVTIKIKARPVAPSYWDFVSKEWVTTTQEENNAKAEACNQQLNSQASQAVLSQTATLNSALRKGRLRRASKRTKPQAYCLGEADQFRQFTSDKYRVGRRTP